MPIADHPTVHSHSVIIGGAFDAATHGSVIVHAVTGLEANGIAQVPQQVRRWPLRVLARRGLLPPDDARAMEQRDHGACFCVERSVRVEAPTAPGARGCSDTAAGRRSPWPGYADSNASACFTGERQDRVRAGAARCVFSRHRS
jgi:hypothetical protein